ncbi:MAG: hypothetical protein FJ241_11265 [Nitrospira sp.]|nr:hypothetical protein [Nitrospira sp.]
MWKIETKFSVKLGGNTYINTPNLVVYKGEPLFRIYRSESDGILGIDFDIFNSQKKRVATIRKSIVVQGDANNYEIKTGHDEYSVTEKNSGRLIASVKRRGVQGAELEVTVHLYTPDGFLFDATPTQTNVGGMMMTGCTIKDCGAGIVIA